jgi:hypothetical protein
METRLNIPRNWQDFEVLCHKLWSYIWSDPNAERNGRQGQPQHGVDVFGKPAYKDYLAGVQCKDKDSRLGSKLSIKELEAECVKAHSFKPTIQEFTMATTAARDGSIQLHARSLNEINLFPFKVHVWAWDEIEEEIRCRPILLKAYYPDVYYAQAGLGSVRANVSFIAHEDQCHAFFSRPEIQRLIPPGLSESLMTLCYELSDNAYSHGKASQFSIICSNTSIRLEDNGIPFNPITGLDPTQVSAKSHIGSYVFKIFSEKYNEILKIGYEHITNQGEGKNVLNFEFCKPIVTLEASPKEVLIDMSLAAGRNGAERLAASISIPKTSQELTLVIIRFHNPSALVEFIVCMLKRIEKNVRLIIYLPRDDYSEGIESFLQDERLSIRFR